MIPRHFYAKLYLYHLSPTDDTVFLLYHLLVSTNILKSRIEKCVIFKMIFLCWFEYSL